MKHMPRHEEILKILTKLRSVSVQELTSRLNVSEVTIRKDLRILEEMGYLLRTHGGASIAEDSRILSNLHTRKTTNIEAKKKIALRAKELVREGDTIYLDSGSSCQLLAEALRGISLRIITNSLDVMNTLAEEPDISLICLGGSYRKAAGSFVGPLPIEALKNFQIETCFIGATGILPKAVFSSQNIMESQLKEQVLAVSGRRVVLADSGKFGHSAFSVFARAGDIDILITDNGLGNPEQLQGLGFEIILA